MLKSYSFDKKNKFSKSGIKIVNDYLSNLQKTINIKNVEEDPEYQKKDIDLIWTYKKNGKEISIPLEIKTDNYTTCNFWLETLSNEEFDTLGCFMKSKAKYFFYYFIKWDSLYVIPLKIAQKWFRENYKRFKESKTTTKDNEGNYKHTTVGRIVPIKIMIKEVKGIKLIKNLSNKNQ